MRLGDRIAAVSHGTAAGEQPGARDPLARLKSKAQSVLFERLGGLAEDGEFDEVELRRLAVDELEEVLADEVVPLSRAERDQLVDEIAADILGFGPLQPFLSDPEITEIMVNGLDFIWIERNGRLELTDEAFASDDHLRRVIERIVVGVGRRIDESSPMVDARLADGSRVNAVIPPLAVDGPTLTIRKFRDSFLTAIDFIRTEAISEHALEFLACAVEGRLNILVSGGTGSGKTTLLNLLSSFIPSNERIVTIEDSVELRLRQRHVVRFETRPSNIEGRGEVTIRDLVKNSLRVRPDRIIVGECRGGETLDMLQAMNTGHDGSLSTLHANSPGDALSRLETMVLMSGVELPIRAVRDQISAAVDVIVHVGRLRDGTRRVVEIVEIGDVVDGEVAHNSIYRFDWAKGLSADGRVAGSLLPTGSLPWCTDKLLAAGLDLPDMDDPDDVSGIDWSTRGPGETRSPVAEHSSAAATLGARVARLDRSSSMPVYRPAEEPA